MSCCGVGGPVIAFDERGFNRVEIDVGAPLHAVAGKQLSFAGHRAELNDLQRFDELHRQRQEPFANFVHRDRVPIVPAGRLHDISNIAGFVRLVPGFRRIETRRTLLLLSALAVGSGGAHRRRGAAMRRRAEPCRCA